MGQHSLAGRRKPACRDAVESSCVAWRLLEQHFPQLSRGQPQQEQPREPEQPCWLSGVVCLPASTPRGGWSASWPGLSGLRIGRACRSASPDRGPASAGFGPAGRMTSSPARTSRQLARPPSRGDFCPASQNAPGLPWGWLRSLLQTAPERQQDAAGLPGGVSRSSLSIVREIGERNGASRRFLIDQTGGNTGG